MNIRLNVVWAGAALALAGIAALPAVAGEWNKETIFRFNQPVEVPGHVLTPGRYVFRLADSASDRNIVEIFRKDKQQNQHLVTTILAIPDYSETTPEKPKLNFEERAAKNPEAIKAWFYPGDEHGWEFVYPKPEPLETAVNTPAPRTPPPSPASHPVAAAAEPPQAAPLPAAEPSVSDEEVIVAQATVIPEPAPAPAARQLPHRLPKTASSLPLFQLVGGLFVTAGLLVLRPLPVSVRG